MHAPVWFTLYVCMHACVCEREKDERKEREEGLSVTALRSEVTQTLCWSCFPPPTLKHPFPVISAPKPSFDVYCWDFKRTLSTLAGVGFSGQARESYILQAQLWLCLANPPSQPLLGARLYPFIFAGIWILQGSQPLLRLDRCFPVHTRTFSCLL